VTENGVQSTSSNKKEIDRKMIAPFLVDMDISSKASVNSIKNALGQFFNYMEEKKITTPHKTDIVIARKKISM